MQHYVRMYAHVCEVHAHVFVIVNLQMHLPSRKEACKGRAQEYRFSPKKIFMLLEKVEARERDKGYRCLRKNAHLG